MTQPGNSSDLVFVQHRQLTAPRFARARVTTGNSELGFSSLRARGHDSVSLRSFSIDWRRSFARPRSLPLAEGKTVFHEVDPVVEDDQENVEVLCTVVRTEAASNAARLSFIFRLIVVLTRRLVKRFHRNMFVPFSTRCDSAKARERKKVLET